MEFEKSKIDKYYSVSCQVPENLFVTSGTDFAGDKSSRVPNLQGPIC